MQDGSRGGVDYTSGSSHLKIIAEGNQVDFYLRLCGCVELLGPDDLEEVVGPDAGLEGEEEGVVLGVAVVVVGDLGGRGVDVPRAQPGQKHQKQYARLHAITY